MVTSEPKRAHTLPSSRPITPAPIMPSFSGTAENSSAPVELTIFVSLNFAELISIGFEPVAKIIFLASIISVELPLATSTFLLERSLP